jgi:hypothetical protein
LPRPQSSSASRFTAGRCVGLFYFPTLGNSRGRAYVSFLGGYLARRNSMTKSARIAVAVALLLGGTSLAMAKTRGAAGAHRHPSHPSINETTSRPTPANPYYRLSEQYYDFSDPYRGLYDFFAVPPYIPGYTYRHMRMPGR